jgi:hypothetical protein
LPGAPRRDLERTTQTLAINGVTFQTVLGRRFVGAENDGGGAVNAVATVAQAWEKFSIEDINGGTLENGDRVFIRAGNGQLFQAMNGGGSTLNAGSNNTLEWETFAIEKQSGGGTIHNGDVIGLQTWSGNWVSAQNGGGGPIFAYGGALGPWEELIIDGLAESSSPPIGPGQPTLPNGRGATLNFVEYEAEAMVHSGVVMGPTRTFGQVASEASGRRAVRLSDVGQFVQFTNATPSNSIVVRYSIPDFGPDFWASLSVYVNGSFRSKLWVTSRYSWTYGGDGDFNKPWQNDPSIGNPHHFFDEAHALIGDIPVGATVMLRKDGDDGAPYYDVDLIDLEQVPAPLGQPPGFLSLSGDCGATPNDNSDDSNAIQGCVDRARGEGRGVYIPPGVFNSYSRTISVAGVTIQGAGMWYSAISGFFARFDCWGNGCQYFDFAVLGDSTQRIDDSPDTAFGGNGSSGVVLDGIWIEHSKVGYWTGPDTNGLVIRNCRIRDLFADGVNFFAGTSNSVAENNHVRNSGDDAFAAWSATFSGSGPDRNNVFRHNYVQLPWKANCFALYGGDSNRIEDNVCADVVQYPGVLLARQFGSFPFTGATQVTRNTLIRAGAFAFGQEQGALKMHADEGSVENLVIADLDIVNPTFYGVHVQGQNSIGSVWLGRVNVSDPGSGAFFLNWGSRGAMNADDVVATGSPRGVRDDSGGNFTIIRGAGDVGW